MKFYFAGIAFFCVQVLSAQQPVDTARLSDLYKRAEAYRMDGHDTAALALCQEAIRICTAAKDSARLAKAWHSTGSVYFHLSDYPRALDYQEKALDYYRRKKDRIQTGEIISSIGEVYQFASDYPKSLDYLLQALRIFEQADDKYREAQTLTSLGGLYRSTANYPRSLDYQRRALALSRQLNDPKSISRDLGNLASSYDFMDSTRQSLELYRQALAIDQSLNDHSAIARDLGNIGIDYESLTDYGHAVEYLEQSTAMHRQSGAQNDLAIALFQLADAYGSAPDSTLKRLGVPPSQRYPKALSYLQEALKIGQAIRSPIRQEFAWEGLSVIYEMQKKFDKSLEAYKNYILFRDSIDNKEKAKEITRKEMLYEFSKKESLQAAENDKQQALAAAGIRRQRLVRNTVLGGAGFLLLAAAVLFVFYKRKRDAQSLQQEAELKAEMSETEMKALRAQMNPHFIFNSLNSVSDFIVKNDTKAADHYLNSFSRLMRMILENSEWKEVSLKDDLKALDIYIDLEKLRLNHAFTYEIRVDEDIDQEMTMLPPLILQPFVENSIWHGVSGLPGSGRILIDIKKREDTIICTVEDNGPGMTARKTVSGHNKERKSMGMSITNKRINILNKIKHSNASVEISSLPTGTRVEVRLPLELRF